MSLGSNADLRKRVLGKFRQKPTRKLKFSLPVLYFSVFIFIFAMISIGYKGPQASSVVANASSVNSQVQGNETSVDNVIATDVAANVAHNVNLPVAMSVSNLAVSARIKSEFSQSEGVNTAKPQIIKSTETDRAVTSYTAVAGDTVPILAAKFNISEETIKWANNLTSSTIAEGSVVKILPVNGVLYSVKSSDTIDSIATKYEVDKDRLVLYNDLDLSGLKPNTSIILPSANLPTTERPGYVAPRPVINYYVAQGSGFGGSTWYISTGNAISGPYAYGNCTLYAYNRRIQLGLPVGGRDGIPQWGHATSWAGAAAASSMYVSRTPSIGAIMQNQGGYGHVAIVESILPNGDISISEMNAYVSGGGYNIVSGRIVPSASVAQYLYIR